MNDLPLVSVLMTAYNREKYIAEAIESVLASTYTNFELIIVDDGSKDSTVIIARSYEAKDSRVKVFVNEKNLGDYPNRNKAASYANGKYLKYLDSDDIIYPHGLEVMVRCMIKFPTAGLGLVKLHTNESSLPIQLLPEETYFKNFTSNGILGNAPGSAIILKEAFEKVGKFSGRRYIGDNELWFKISAEYPIVLIPGYLGWVRKHEHQESKFDYTKYQILRYFITIEALDSEKCPLSKDIRKKFLLKLHKLNISYAIKEILFKFKILLFIKYLYISYRSNINKVLK